MKRIVVSSFGLMLAIAVASPNCWAAISQYTGPANGDFNTDANWTPPGSGPSTVTGGNVPSSNQYIINGGRTSAYATNVVTNVGSLVVGADYPVTGDFGTAGTLNMSAGSMTVSGGGSAFTIARACCAGDGIVNMTGNAALTILGTDPQVGQRDHGELHVGPSASVTSPNGYWRLGNYGASIDVSATAPTGLQGDGLLDVQGTFSAMVIFIGDSDSHGELRVSGAGSVTLADNLVPNVATSFPNRSALVQMIGSTASLRANNDESANGASQVHNQYKFTADAGGVSKITLVDAVNIDNNDLTVNLGSFAISPGSPLTLFDAAPNRVFGTFANVTITGANSAGVQLVYNQTLGDIQLVIPEPSTMALLGLGMVMTILVAKRRESR
jgi:hypothetical protein